MIFIFNDMQVITFGPISDYEYLYNECLNTLTKFKDNSTFIFIDSIHPKKIEWIKNILNYAKEKIYKIDLNNIDVSICKKYDRRFLSENAYIEPETNINKFNFILGRKQRDVIIALSNKNYEYKNNKYIIHTQYEDLEYTKEELDIFYTYYKISKPYLIYNRKIYLVNSKDFYVLINNSKNKIINNVDYIICSDYRKYGITKQKRRKVISINLTSLVYLKKDIPIYNFIIDNKFILINPKNKLYNIYYQNDNIISTKDITKYSRFINWN